MAGFSYVIIRTDGSRYFVEEEPAGNESLQVEITRHAEFHGFFEDWSLNKLVFRKDGMQVLKDEYDTYFPGEIGTLLELWYQCNETSSRVKLRTLKVAYDEYEEGCGLDCYVAIGLDDSEVETRLLGNYEQVVDINSPVAITGETLDNYTGLGFNLQIPPRDVLVRVGGTSEDFYHQPNPLSIGLTTPVVGTLVVIRPSYSVNSLAEVADSFPVPGISYAVTPQPVPNPYPTGIDPLIRLVNDIKCSVSTFRAVGRVKATYKHYMLSPFARNLTVHVVLAKMNDYVNLGSPYIARTIVFPQANVTPGSTQLIDIDWSFDNQFELEPGETVGVFIATSILYGASGTTPFAQFEVHWDTATTINIETISRCLTTQARSYMINEVLARVVESITGKRATVYSELFGRTDSQPFALPGDSCAGLHSITSGLNLRRKLLTDGTLPKYSLSLKMLFEMLNPLHNMGLSIERNTAISNDPIVRLESYKYFYQVETGLILNDPVGIVVTKLDPTKMYTRMSIGFGKWEAGGISGLDELMTTRTYRTGLVSTDNHKELISDMICSPYTIEETRTLPESTQDSTYDNDTFGFFLKRTLVDFIVEQYEDNVINIENVVSPSSNYNARYTPARMAMRWFPWVMQVYKYKIAAARLAISSGTGNYTAKLLNLNCEIAGVTINEGTDITLGLYASPSIDGTPVLTGEMIELTHVMDFSSFYKLISNPVLRYRTVYYNCGGSLQPAYISSLIFNFESGTADFKLFKKYSLPVTVMEPCLAGLENGTVEVNNSSVTFDFDVTTGGATQWVVTITNLNTLAVVEQTFEEHPFTVEALPNGQYSYMIRPWCGPENPSAETINGSFEIDAEFQIFLTAEIVMVPVGDDEPPVYRMRLTADSLGTPAPNNIQFAFGQCVRDLTTDIGVCSGYPADPYPTIYYDLGSILKQEYSLVNTPETSNAQIDQIVLHHLFGITPSRLVKAPGQTWNLIFM